VFRFGSLLVINLPKETPLAVVKTAVHAALSCYMPTDCSPSLVSMSYYSRLFTRVWLSGVTVKALDCD